MFNGPNDGGRLLSRRMFLALAAIGCLSLSATVQAEILTKGSFGSREAYLKRVQDLSGVLIALPRSDERNRAEMRAIASTLSAAVKDMLFNEAQARGGKVAPPASALQVPPGPSKPGEAGDETVPIAKIPDDWLLLKGGQVQDDAADLLALLEDEGEPVSSAAIDGLVNAITLAVSELNRPGS